jgi:hypothetical protein
VFSGPIFDLFRFHGNERGASNKQAVGIDSAAFCLPAFTRARHSLHSTTAGLRPKRDLVRSGAGQKRAGPRTRRGGHEAAQEESDNLIPGRIIYCPSEAPGCAPNSNPTPVGALGSI